MPTNQIIDKKTGRFVRQYNREIITCECGNELEVAEYRKNDGRGKYCSKRCMYKYRNKPIEEEHHAWSGQKPKYSALHKWLASKHGQKMTCEWCGYSTDNTFQIHWANITGDYSRDIKNWARLCAKCHWHYDRKGEKLYV